MFAINCPIHFAQIRLRHNFRQWEKINALKYSLVECLNEVWRGAMNKRADGERKILL